MNYDVTVPGAVAPGVDGVVAWKRVGNVKNASQKVLFIESHYEAVWQGDFGFLTAEGPITASGILSTTPAAVSAGYSPPRHKGGFVASFCDGSARIIPFSERPEYVAGAMLGDGKYWDLERP
jgi:prepilin-type processing-associated H-X9-DG protein